MKISYKLENAKGKQECRIIYNDVTMYINNVTSIFTSNVSKNYIRFSGKTKLIFYCLF